MYRHGLHTVRHGFKLRRISPSSLCSSGEVLPRRNGRRRDVPTMKWLATKLTRDEMAGNKVYPRRNAGDETAATKRWGRNGGDETTATKWQRRNVLLQKVLPP